ncbi:MAG6450 family protein [Lysinibacillus sp. NPDC097162]|uniref:MAG6450 family protein n=1 Tax=Lysinibacillus sp. NPDC097162 TaxID=3364140 RepID=UPI003830C08E
MQLIINEISIENKFLDLTDFLTHLKEILLIYKLDIEDLEIYKPSYLYEVVLFDEVKFWDILRDRQYSRDDVIRRYKILLNNMINKDPYWDLDMKHNILDEYNCEFTPKKYNYGIAEACERDKVVLSFSCEEFLKCEIINVTKNGNTTLDIVNICSKDTLLEHMKEADKINPLSYCKLKFQGSNICFDEIDEVYGFELLDKENVEIFIAAFNQFSQMNWQQISSSDGLRFKPYSPSKEKESWFYGTPHQAKNIFKFRVTQKFRCFGYREDGVFYVLRFEVDHKISDEG